MGARTLTVVTNAKRKPRSRLAAMLRQRCPRCLTGRVYRSMFGMNEACPDCGFEFGREEGYFTGAMYFSFMLALGLVFGIYGVLWLLSSRTMYAGLVILGITCALYIAFIPVVFRYSRVIWLYFDNRFGPEGRLARKG